MSVHHLPIIGAPYRHQDGGLYRVLSIGKSTVDQSRHVVYAHLYPFESGVWIRPFPEWTPERFVMISDAEVAIEIDSTDRATRQQEITAAKAKRRGLTEVK